MIFRITAGLYFLLVGLSAFHVGVPPVLIAVFALIAGIALLLGL